MEKVKIRNEPKQKRKSKNTTKKVLWRNICQCAYTLASCSFQARYEELKMFFLALNISKIKVWIKYWPHANSAL